jgi:alkylation response protein AidB-like acyl-CoA dehydrogenase
MLAMTVVYVAERHQFGVPVGSFRAVEHHLADALQELAFARPAVHRAAHSLAAGADARPRDVSMAKAIASDAARFAGRRALHCHGAIGYTVEHDLHLYLKRTWALAAAWGDAAGQRDRVGSAIGIRPRPSHPTRGAHPWTRPTSSTQSAPRWASAGAGWRRSTPPTWVRTASRR